MKRRSLVAGALAIPMASMLGAASVFGQGRATTIVVGSTAGGSTDTLARMLAKLLSTESGRSYIVDNKAGAGGNIAAAQVARSAPDGNILLMAFTGHTINATLYKNLRFDPVADFTPITMVAKVPNLLVARKDAPYDTTGELIDYARAHPGKINIAVAGQGSSVHLATEDFKMRAGVQLVNVPYKGTSPALLDIMAGTVDLMFAGTVSALSQVQAGGLKAIGIGSRMPIPQLPDVPALSDTVKGFESTAWFGLFAPANLPAEVSADLYRAVRKCLNHPDFVTKLDAEAAIRISMTPQEFDRFVRDDIVYWRDVITKAAVVLDV